MKIKILKGFVLGLLANVVGVFLYVYFFSGREFEYVIEKGIEQGFIGSLIGLGAILNVLLFFFFLTGKIGKFRKPVQPYEARGVIMATILAAFAVLYFEF
ncbi:hypothetical protein SAMN05192588_2925 [Nonlabens sp. Hel1_33_55]|uniref:hypothetical protein n=1 Tax=Nonlabens sp. Hel1_33_55 TaxID=1336802 RepID=UPI000875BF56|nr:hypothetical protein [Nonlabens sp. Hel1_33_55]SCY44373.1 hypothetical protein SAMN05192588_2925 [Nonlabens sp. Hel1_33_55]